MGVIKKSLNELNGGRKMKSGEFSLAFDGRINWDLMHKLYLELAFLLLLHVFLYDCTRLLPYSPVRG